MEHAIVMINQNFSLFCCAEQYSISFTDQSLSSDSDYFVRYTYPDGATTDSSAQLLANGCVLTSQSPEYDHPCTVHAKLYASYEQTEDLAEFSLDLVSPVEYLFRKFSANEFEMSDKISDKMTSALLAMSLSYYYVMGEHVEKETRTDEILSTLLNCSQHKMYMNTTRQKKDSSSEQSITQFAEHFKLQSTLKYLSGGSSVGDLPVQLPKPMFPIPSAKKAISKRPAIIPRAKVNTLPANSNSVYQVPNNRPLSEYSVLQPVVNQDTEYMVMDNPDLDNPKVDSPEVDNPESYAALNPINDEEDYYLMEQTDDRESKTHYQKPLRATKSTSFSHQASKPLPSRPHSTIENVIIDEVYELCGSTPVEAAAAAMKKRGPPPRPPAPYHTLNTNRGQPGRKISSDLESSLESSLQETRISSTVKPEKVSPQAISPLPRKKFNPFHKSKAKQST